MKEKKLIGWRDLAALLAGAALYGVGLHVFVTPAEIAPGGAVGLALLGSYLWGTPVGLGSLLLNVPLLLLAWFFLSRRFAALTALASAVCSLILDGVISPLLGVYGGDRLLASLYGGALVGAGMGLILRRGMSTGGTDIAGCLLQKRWPHLSIGAALLVVDGAVLALSVPVFGDLESGLMGLLCLCVQTKVIDRVVRGGQAGTMVIVVTRSGGAISEEIIRRLDRSATLLSGRGAYSGQEADVLLCTVAGRQFAPLKAIVRRLDPSAFVVVTAASRVLGCGFQPLQEQFFPYS